MILQEDFSRPKVIFQEIVQESQFFYDAADHFMWNLAVSLFGGELHPLPLEPWLISAKKWIATP